MKYKEFFSLERTCILNDRDKKVVFKKLIELIHKENTQVSSDEIYKRIMERETLLSTRITDDVGIPHAKIPQFNGTLAAVALCKNPIIYDSNKDKPVKLIILIVGDGNMHLNVLSWIAKKLSDEKRLYAILHAGTAKDVHHFLTIEKFSKSGGKKEVKNENYRRQKDSMLILEKAYDLAKQLGITKLCYHVSKSNLRLSISHITDVKVYTIITGSSTFPEEEGNDLLVMPFKNLDRINQVEFSLIYLISKHYIKRNEKILSILGSPDSDELDTIIISNTKDYQFLFHLEDQDRPIDLEQQIFMRMLQLANELAREGREGKSIGTLYILGDSNNVQKYIQQMVVNPFGGYREEDRNVLDPGLQATIKEFSKIDGACIIRGDGVLLTCGTYIKAGTEGDSAQKGYGARHTAAANITSVTDALAIVISESTRRVSVFKNGFKILYF